jgi:REP element-mobilizing transposase RayT
MEREPGVYHVWARGNNKQAIFLDRLDRLMYLRLLAGIVARHDWRCLGYCLMRNHVHLLIETEKPNLGDGMRELHGAYARWFNWRHKRRDHVFGDRYGSKQMKSDAQLKVAGAYVVNNPVAAGLCERAEDWAWSSHRAVLEGTPPAWLDVERLLWFFGSRERYADFVSERASRDVAIRGNTRTDTSPAATRPAAPAASTTCSSSPIWVAVTMNGSEVA